MRHICLFRPAIAAGVFLLSACRDQPSGPSGLVTGSAHLLQSSAVASMYAPDFVATAASGYDLNDAGDVVGRSYRDTGCGPFCLPPEDVAIWRNGIRTVLPLVTGYPVSSQFPNNLTNQGVIGGVVGIPGSSTKAALWTPSGGGYTAQNLGALPGMSHAEVGGMDEQGRMVGWSTTGGAIPTAAAPFMWSAATGMVDLRALGYPNERPAAMSPGGKVVTWGSSYQLGNPASVLPLPALPSGFLGAGSNGSAINDAGDQAHFLVSVSGQNLVYPFRLSNGGTWQMISSAGTGHLSRYGMGSINAAQDIALTVQSTAMVAVGPAGVAQPLAPLVSPAYPSAALVAAGSMNNSGQILSSVMIGRSPRLMVLSPVASCGANCLVVSSLAMTGQFVQDPLFPGSCFAGGRMYNLSSATVTVTSETGAPLANVQVTGRFLDDYWTDSVKTGLTNASGVVSFTHKGLCGVGAIAFLVDKTVLGTRTLDRTRGTLTNFVIPSVTPPPNQAPTAAFTYTCAPRTPNPGFVCLMNGSTSSDADGSVVAWNWTSPGKPSKTGMTTSWNFPTAGTASVTLMVTDNLGATGSTTQTIVIGGPPANMPPVAAFTINCYSRAPSPGYQCDLNGSGSSDPDGSIVSWAWTSPGKANKSGATAFYVFPTSGTKSFTLTVTDNLGATNALTQSVLIP